MWNLAKQRADELWQKHQKDPISVKMWVIENPNSVFYYVKHALLNWIYQTKMIPLSPWESKLCGNVKWCQNMDKGMQLHSIQYLAQINIGYGNVFHFVKLLTNFKCFTRFNLLTLDCVFFSTFYTQCWCLKNGKMEYPLHSLSLEKAKKIASIQSYNHYHEECRMIGCHLLSLWTMFKLKSTSWSMITTSTNKS